MCIVLNYTAETTTCRCPFAQPPSIIPPSPSTRLLTNNIRTNTNNTYMYTRTQKNTISFVCMYTYVYTNFLSTFSSASSLASEPLNYRVLAVMGALVALVMVALFMATHFDREVERYVLNSVYIYMCVMYVYVCIYVCIDELSMHVCQKRSQNTYLKRDIHTCQYLHKKAAYMVAWVAKAWVAWVAWVV